MSLDFIANLTGIGLAAGFMAGLLGIGGGIVIIPLLTFVAGLSIKAATGISIVQALFATISGLLVHRRNRTVDVRLGFSLGAGGVVGSLAGSFGSALVHDTLLTALYLFVVAIGILLLFFAPRGQLESSYTVNIGLAAVMGLGVGVLAGMLGVGGGFIIVPLMISVLKVPTRTAVGTSLLVILPSTFSGSIGKIATGQFDFALGVIVILGSIVGAQIGGRVNSKLTPLTVQLLLGALLVVIFLRTAWGLTGSL